MSFTPIKKLGQHFLTDPALIDILIQLLCPRKNQHWLEIGAGLGALTRPLTPLVKRLDVVEIDHRLIKTLKETLPTPTLIFHEQDVLRFNLNSIASIPRSLYICGNLPYQISTPLLFHIFEELPLIHSLFFMLQKEVVERLAANPGEKSYGRLTVHTQYYCQVIPLIDVPPHAFSPPPKVRSAFVKLIPYSPPLYPPVDEKLFHDIIQQAFMARRKALRNALKKWLSPIDFEHLAISPQARPDQLTVAEYVRICQHLFR
ncbi:MAG: 16S rRNA (adenine(1518)-N(6)/adenine(1519)-N(6))-dimethyltransferase RsmA [Gammaproteobacteria bacterium]|nr:16S rRNA (adenine(1518)-N(6)/adenine(1519)-N(6))-dimethyltransferase RsmA [Gammaproteobacteria bacterium]